MEFPRPSQPATDTFVSYMNDYLSTEVDKLNQDQVDGLSNRDLAPDQIRNAGLAIEERHQEYFALKRELGQYLESYSRRIRELGIELPGDQELAQAILEGRYLKAPQAELEFTDDSGFPYGEDPDFKPEDWEKLPHPKTNS